MSSTHTRYHTAVADTPETDEVAGEDFVPDADPQTRIEPEPIRRSEPSVRLYIGIWLPAAGAIVTYGVMHGSWLAGIVGVELLLVGWYTLGKLKV